MKSVRITVDGITYTLVQTATDQWTVTNRAPYIAGEYPVEVTVTTEAGQTTVVDVDDPELVKALLLIVNEGTTHSGELMLKYWTDAIQKIKEFQAIAKTEGFEIDFLKNDVELILNEAYLTTMTEERVHSWEKALGITASREESLQDRRDTIIARIRGQGKLNTALINSIVSTFTEGTANSYIKDSVLHIDITPPPNNRQYRFQNVAKELTKKVPAHLGVVVTRKYATWKEVTENYADWNAVSQLENWNDLKLWIAPQ